MMMWLLHRDGADAVRHDAREAHLARPRCGRGGESSNQEVAVVAHEKIACFMHLAQKANEYALQHGKGASTSPILIHFWFSFSDLRVFVDEDGKYDTPTLV